MVPHYLTSESGPITILWGTVCDEAFGSNLSTSLWTTREEIIVGRCWQMFESSEGESSKKEVWRIRTQNPSDILTTLTAVCECLLHPLPVRLGAGADYGDGSAVQHVDLYELCCGGTAPWQRAGWCREKEGLFFKHVQTMVKIVSSACQFCYEMQ